jgi:hypothetical protein
MPSLCLSVYGSLSVCLVESPCLAVTEYELRYHGAKLMELTAQGSGQI